MTKCHKKYSNISIHKLKGIEEIKRAHTVRHNVFVIEQGYSADWEIDDLDHIGTHWIATCDQSDENGVVIRTNVDIGTIRFIPKKNGLAKLTRFAVLEDARGLQVGQRLVQVFVEHCKELGYHTIVLHSQYPRRGFYQKVGFVLEEGDDDIFDEAGTPHVRLWMRNIKKK